jgi:hypothetical protein
VKEEWAKQQSEELCYLYSSTNINRIIKSRSRHVSSGREMKNIYKILAGKPEGKIITPEG